MWTLRAQLAVLLVFATLANCKHEMYKGNQVWGFHVSDPAQAQISHEYEARHDLDSWAHAVLGHSNGSVMLQPHQLEGWRQAMAEAGIQYWIEVHDVMEYLEEFDESVARTVAQRGSRLLPFPGYPRYQELDDYMVELGKEFPEYVQVVSAGPSFEGRDIKYVKISTTNFEDASKPIVFMDAMIHAREWVTTPVAILAMHKMLVDRDEADADLLQNIDWIIMPLTNPDGYEYTHTDARLWRKTRSTTHAQGDECPGVDGNRNFDFQFNTLGVNSNPCSLTYPGEQPFSEPETRYVRDILLEYLPRLELYIAIHSQGNLVLFGYGDRSLPDNPIPIHHMAAAIGSEIDRHKLPQALHYRSGNSAHLLYETSGIASDYAQALGVPFSYTFELPGYGYGHSVPVTYMEQVAMETWEGVKVGARLSVTYYRAKNGP